MKICIYGSANEKIDDKYKDAVKDLSVKLAKRGHSLVFGGGKHGVMGASARGFNEVGGGILGITPEFFKLFDVECLYEQCTDRIWVETMHERKYNMEEISDAFVICPGGIGTYDEFFSVLTNKQLDRTVKPIRLTEAGSEYVHSAEQIAQIEKSFDSYLESVNNLESGSLNIGSNQLLSSLVLPQYISSFIKAHPKIRLSLTDANSTTLSNSLMRGELDLIVDNHLLDRAVFEMQHLATEHLLLAVPRVFVPQSFRENAMSYLDILNDLHLSGQSVPIDLAVFRDVPFILMNRDNDIREHTDKLFDSQHFSPTVILEIDRLVTLYNFIRIGTAASVVSDTLIRHTDSNSEEVLFFNIDDSHSKRKIFVSYKKTKYISKAMDLFISHLSNCTF